jgi:hypothetical protein
MILVGSLLGFYVEVNINAVGKIKADADIQTPAASGWLSDSNRFWGRQQIKRSSIPTRRAVFSGCGTRSGCFPYCLQVCVPYL